MPSGSQFEGFWQCSSCLFCHHEEGGLPVKHPTMRWVLRHHGVRVCWPWKKSLLQNGHLQHELKFESTQKKPNAFWKKVSWSDETNIEPLGCNDKSHLWRSKGEVFKLVQAQMQATMASTYCCRSLNQTLLGIYASRGNLQCSYVVTASPPPRKSIKTM